GIGQPEEPAKIASFADPADPVIAEWCDIIAAVGLVPGTAPTNRNIADGVDSAVTFFDLNLERRGIDQQPNITATGSSAACKKTVKQQQTNTQHTHYTQQEFWCILTSQVNRRT
ncbi:MAG: hypothetical protein ACU83V_11250, partial [Gammaproteobacteria bacterium]